MNLDQAIDPARPILQFIGTVLLIAGVLKFFGINVPVNGSGIELAAIGFFTKSI